MDGDQDEVGLFIDQQWQTDNLGISAGLRADYIDQSSNGHDENDGKLNFRLAGDWTPGDHWQLSAELGSGIRFASLSERYFNGITPRGKTLGNPNLDAEESMGLQLATRYQLDTWTATATIYQTVVDNYIERYAITDELRGYRNLERADIEGVELELEYSHGNWLHALSYQWQQGEDRDGQYLADLNPPAWRYMLAWQVDNLGFRSDLNYRLDRSDFGEDEQPLGSAVIWNLAGNLQLGSNWRLSLYANNVMDQRYFGSAGEDASYQPGRAVGVEMQWGLGGAG